MRQMGSHPLNIFFMNYVNDLYPFTGVHVNHAMFFFCMYHVIIIMVQLVTKTCKIKFKTIYEKQVSQTEDLFN